jgi:uncharacterized protein (TIGR03643 family)
MAKEFKQYEIDRIIGMAWEDRTPFDAIEHQFGLSEEEVIKLMRKELKRNSWERWRKRVSGRDTKHRKLRSDKVKRFVSAAQNPITGNRISKKKY